MPKHLGFLLQSNVALHRRLSPLPQAPFFDLDQTGRKIVAPVNEKPAATVLSRRVSRF